ncbi:MAG: hypothetical protein IJP92_09385, partial [Lachnospiraceae bacterium]|nr:hypothetical protein [Lachnospiraceae bacterium]
RRGFSGNYCMCLWQLINNRVSAHLIRSSSSAYTDQPLYAQFDGSVKRKEKRSLGAATGV